MTCLDCGTELTHTRQIRCTKCGNIHNARRKAASNKMSYSGMILGYLRDEGGEMRPNKLGRHEFGRVLSGVNV